MRYVNLFTPFPISCSVLTEVWKPPCGDHSVWIVWWVYIAKIWFGAGCKILSRSVLRRGPRVCTTSTYYICVLLVHVYIINPLTPELNPSAQRFLTSFLLEIFLLEPCISLIYAWKTNKYTNYSFSLLIMYGSSYMLRHYIAILKELS
jgi:hypothetical protein